MPRKAKSSQLSKELQRRFQKLHQATYDSVAANNLNAKDLQKIKTVLTRMREDLLFLEEDIETRVEEEQTELHKHADFKIKRKMVLKKKNQSGSFGSWIFNNNEI